MACCSDIGTGAAANVLASLLKKVVQEVKKVISLPQSLRDMEVEVQTLNNLIHDINVELAQVQMNPKRVVKAWLDKAGEAIERSRSISTDYQQHENWLSCCPNCFYRYRISNNVRDWKVMVAQLHSERPSGEYGDYTPPAQMQIEIPKSGFIGNAIERAQLKLEERLIEDSNIRIIGVFGMGGVGKTSLLQTINNSLKVRNAFDPIIWVTVSKDYDILNLQGCIANRLNLQNFPSDLEGRKHRLWSYLSDKKFLVILDDMWKSLELQSLGVSLNDTGSKIVLTTRIREVCTNMEADDTIKVEPLSEEEGWQLFCSRAFRNGNVPQEKEDVARKIAGECKGLPLAINVVAAAMRNNTYQHQWEHDLRQMQNIDQTFYGMHYEIEEKLFQSLIWSYNVLQDDLKTCFVYFAAFPEDAVIRCEDIIDVWIAEGLVKSSGDCYLPDTGHSFIDFLWFFCRLRTLRNEIN